jgi:hypothetical protein
MVPGSCRHWCSGGTTGNQPELVFSIVSIAYGPKCMNVFCRLMPLSRRSVFMHLLFKTSYFIIVIIGQTAFTFGPL